MTISLHHNAGMPYHEYFNDIEPIFRSYGGRPHWGKKHSLTAEQLRPLYPKWNAFLEAGQHPTRTASSSARTYAPFLEGRPLR